MKILFITCGGIQNALSQVWGFYAAKQAGHEVFVATTLEPFRCVSQLFPLIGIYPVLPELHSGMEFDIVTSGSLRPDEFPKWAGQWKAARVVPPRPADSRHGNIVFDSLNILTDCGIAWNFPDPPFARFLRSPGAFTGIMSRFGEDTAVAKYEQWDVLYKILPKPILLLGNPHDLPKSAQGPDIVNCLGQSPSLVHLLALFGLCRVLVTNHNGMAHFAAACRLPTVTISTEGHNLRGRFATPIGPNAFDCQPTCAPGDIAWTARMAGKCRE